MKILGYCRVSTEEQSSKGVSLEAQRRAIAEECERRGWDLVRVIEDGGYSAKNLQRPGIQECLRLLNEGVGDGLVVARLDRLSRSVLDFSGLMERARNEGWSLAALDLGVDTSTPSGEMMANVLATFAQFERRLISQRTKDAVAVKRSEGVRIGRRRETSAEIVERIVSERQADLTLQAIADGLNADEIPTTRGGSRWWPSTVKAVLKSAAYDASLSEAS